ncbi:binding-protein-dependent transport systems inner membrane component [Ruminiclostridium papyrosolvens DSM 2782]|uniref:Binding-protein-dependent transport systems inner membrane component n=1 Tax=Ruminiclostridium papyrosolvens DSM 2782 TaxID=588581 RepID=F1TGG7_9FIRM|nr:ABC transporter permease [Ruminiclostridium papyrosolvens]EGD46532.1 binding-protein-dependent transport systems inner membrane component [Ruminiclostridium papyrosolvens DSM 2782]WES35262.1 ABC transporter permease [Ruminiclostridium papyrosolvens DSM 2782]
MKKKVTVYAEGMLFINLIWYAIHVIFQTRIIPNPIRVYRSFYLFFKEAMLLHISISLCRIFAGVIIALLLGSLIGYKMAVSDIWNKILNPLVFLTYPIPKTALLPIIMTIFGLGGASKIILITMIIIFQIIITVRDSVTRIDKECIYNVRSMGASQRQILYHVIIPDIIPGILTGLRVTIGTALSILFFCEAYGTSWGMGYYILDAWTRIDYISMYKGILVLSVVGIALFSSIDILEQKIVKWR